MQGVGHHPATQRRLVRCRRLAVEGGVKLQCCLESERGHGQRGGKISFPWRWAPFLIGARLHATLMAFVVVVEVVFCYCIASMVRSLGGCNPLA